MSTTSKLSLISAGILSIFTLNAKMKPSVATYGLLQSTGMFGKQDKDFNKKCKTFAVLGSYVIKAAAHNGRARTTFSANFDLSADMSTAVQGLPIYNSVYVSATGPFGNIKIGNMFTAAMSNYIDGSSLMGGDSGIFGVGLMNMHNAAAYAPVTTGVFYDPGYASSISYESPNMGGFHIAVSYTPNSQTLGLLPSNDEVNKNDAGHATDVGKYQDLKEKPLYITDPSKCLIHKTDCPNNHYIKGIDLMAYGSGGFTTDVVTAAVWYDGGVPHHWNYSIAAAYWGGKANFSNKYSDHDFKIRNLSAYSIGFKLGYKHIKFGAGFVDEGKSCLPKETDNTEYEFGEKANAGKKYTAVLSYILNRNMKLSLGGMYATRKMSKESKDKVSTKAGSLALDYNITNGVSVYCGVNHAKTSTCERAKNIAHASSSLAPFGDNKVTYVTFGSKVSF